MDNPNKDVVKTIVIAALTTLATKGVELGIEFALTQWNKHLDKRQKEREKRENEKALPKS